MRRILIAFFIVLSICIGLAAADTASGQATSANGAYSYGIAVDENGNVAYSVGAVYQGSMTGTTTPSDSGSASATQDSQMSGTAGISYTAAQNPSGDKASTHDSFHGGSQEAGQTATANTNSATVSNTASSSGEFTRAETESRSSDGNAVETGMSALNGGMNIIQSVITEAVAFAFQSGNATGHFIEGDSFATDSNGNFSVSIFGVHSGDINFSQGVEVGPEGVFSNQSLNGTAMKLFAESFVFASNGSLADAFFSVVTDGAFDAVQEANSTGGVGFAAQCVNKSPGFGDQFAGTYAQGSNGSYAFMEMGVTDGGMGSFCQNSTSGPNPVVSSQNVSLNGSTAFAEVGVQDDAGNSAGSRAEVVNGSIEGSQTVWADGTSAHYLTDICLDPVFGFITSHASAANGAISLANDSVVNGDICTHQEGATNGSTSTAQNDVWSVGPAGMVNASSFVKDPLGFGASTDLGVVNGNISVNQSNLQTPLVRNATQGGMADGEQVHGTSVANDGAGNTSSVDFTATQGNLNFSQSAETTPNGVFSNQSLDGLADTLAINASAFASNGSYGVANFTGVTDGAFTADQEANSTAGTGFAAQCVNKSPGFGDQFAGTYAQGSNGSYASSVMGVTGGGMGSFCQNSTAGSGIAVSSQNNLSLNGSTAFAEVTAVDDVGNSADSRAEVVNGSIEGNHTVWADGTSAFYVADICLDPDFGFIRSQANSSTGWSSISNGSVVSGDICVHQDGYVVVDNIFGDYGSAVNDVWTVGPVGSAQASSFVRDALGFGPSTDAGVTAGNLTVNQSNYLDTSLFGNAYQNVTADGSSGYASSVAEFTGMTNPQATMYASFTNGNMTAEQNGFSDGVMGDAGQAVGITGDTGTAYTNATDALGTTWAFANTTFTGTGFLTTGYQHSTAQNGYGIADNVGDLAAGGEGAASTQVQAGDGSMAYTYANVSAGSITYAQESQAGAGGGANATQTVNVTGSGSAESYSADGVGNSAITTAYETGGSIEGDQTVIADGVSASYLTTIYLDPVFGFVRSQADSSTGWTSYANGSVENANLYVHQDGYVFGDYGSAMNDVQTDLGPADVANASSFVHDALGFGPSTDAGVTGGNLTVNQSNYLDVFLYGNAYQNVTADGSSGYASSVAEFTGMTNPQATMYASFTNGNMTAEQNGFSDGVMGDAGQAVGITGDTGTAYTNATDALGTTWAFANTTFTGTGFLTTGYQHSTAQNGYGIADNVGDLAAGGEGAASTQVQAGDGSMAYTYANVSAGSITYAQESQAGAGGGANATQTVNVTGSGSAESYSADGVGNSAITTAYETGGSIEGDQIVLADGTNAYFFANITLDPAFGYVTSQANSVDGTVAYADGRVTGGNLSVQQEGYVSGIEGLANQTVQTMDGPVGSANATLYIQDIFGGESALDAGVTGGNLSAVQDSYLLLIAESNQNVTSDGTFGHATAAAGTIGGPLAQMSASYSGGDMGVEQLGSGFGSTVSASQSLGINGTALVDAWSETLDSLGTRTGYANVTLPSGGSTTGLQIVSADEIVGSVTVTNTGGMTATGFGEASSYAALTGGATSFSDLNVTAGTAEFALGSSILGGTADSVSSGTIAGTGGMQSFSDDGAGNSAISTAEETGGSLTGNQHTLADGTNAYFFANITLDPTTGAVTSQANSVDGTVAYADGRVTGGNLSVQQEGYVSGIEGLANQTVQTMDGPVGSANATFWIRNVSGYGTGLDAGIINGNLSAMQDSSVFDVLSTYDQVITSDGDFGHAFGTIGSDGGMFSVANSTASYAVGNMSSLEFLGFGFDSYVEVSAGGSIAGSFVDITSQGIDALGTTYGSANVTLPNGGQVTVDSHSVQVDSGYVSALESGEMTIGLGDSGLASTLAIWPTGTMYQDESATPGATTPFALWSYSS